MLCHAFYQIGLDNAKQRQAVLLYTYRKFARLPNRQQEKIVIADLRCAFGSSQVFGWLV